MHGMMSLADIVEWEPEVMRHVAAIKWPVLCRFRRSGSSVPP